MNYGSIGMVIGHEITHGYDNNGRLHDGDGIFLLNFFINILGNVRDWWDKITYKNFHEKKECFIEQYGSMQIPIKDNLTCNKFILL